MESLTHVCSKAQLWWGDIKNRVCVCVREREWKEGGGTETQSAPPEPPCKEGFFFHSPPLSSR